jgi:hypothetical protein
MKTLLMDRLLVSKPLSFVSAPSETVSCGGFTAAFVESVSFETAVPFVNAHHLVSKIRNHHFKWWYERHPIRATLLTAPKGAVPMPKTLPAASKEATVSPF